MDRLSVPPPKLSHSTRATSGNSQRHRALSEIPIVSDALGYQDRHHPNYSTPSSTSTNATTTSSPAYPHTHKHISHLDIPSPLASSASSGGSPSSIRKPINGKSLLPVPKTPTSPSHLHSVPAHKQLVPAPKRVQSPERERVRKTTMPVRTAAVGPNGTSSTPNGSYDLHKLSEQRLKVNVAGQRREDPAQQQHMSPRTAKAAPAAVGTSGAATRPSSGTKISLRDLKLPLSPEGRDIHPLRKLVS